MTVVAAHGTDTGRVRERNEDYLWVDEHAGVYVVADGLGGHQAGDVASRLAATTIGGMIATRIGAADEHLQAAAVRELMTRAIETANERVRAAASEAGQELRMGTVIVVALVRPPIAYVSHAGDARAYLARDSTLTRLTADDSVVAQLVAAGELSDAETADDPRRHFVTKIVGQERPVEPSFAEVAVAPGDWLLLCSDGLWDMVDDEAILQELQKTDGDPGGATEALIRAANAAGGTDNISVIAIRVLST
jgi:serine/threonine protein phosphatase PrpC